MLEYNIHCPKFDFEVFFTIYHIKITTRNIIFDFVNIFFDLVIYSFLL